MDKETLSNYGWIVICTLVLAVMIALASPFGAFIADGFNSAKQGLFDTGDSALDVGLGAAGVQRPAPCGIEGHFLNDGKDHTTETTCSNGHKLVCECSAWVVPEGGTYTMSFAVNGKKEYLAGEQLPCGYVARSSDIYTDGEYEYRCDRYCWDTSWNSDSKLTGWGVRPIDRTKTSYGPILNDIAGKNVTLLLATFKGCTNLEIAPEMPNGTTNMDYAFYGCTSLKTYAGAPAGTADGDFSGYVIPGSVTDMSSTFYGCTSLTAAPVIPSNVTNMNSTFMNCNSLTIAPDMSSAHNVTTMQWTFLYCSNLTTAPDISNCTKLTNMDSTFKGCTPLKTYTGSTDADYDFSGYVIPGSVTNMSSTFNSCRKLTSVPAIPNSVTNMGSTFAGCNSLTATPAIPSSVTDMSSTFHGCYSLTTAPIIPNSVTNMSRTFQGCKSLKTYVGSTDADGDFSGYVIPNSVTNMYATFYECRSLTAAPVIPSNVTDMSQTFMNCYALVVAPVIPNSVTNMYWTFFNCSQMTTAPIIPEGVTNMEGTFVDCTNLVTYHGSTDTNGDFSNYIIPSSVTNMGKSYGTFHGCRKLTNAPVIPSGVESMHGVFRNCTSLTGNIVIHANPSEFNGCFNSINFDTQNITLTGTSTMLDELGSTNSTYCAECNGKCNGGH